MPPVADNSNANSVNLAKGTAIVLSIDKVHADRIFSGEKRFELRKRLPVPGFDTVYLYENGNAGIVGAFRVGKVIKSPTAQLWKKVGEAATPKQRFFDYFNGAKVGYAIEIRQPVRFSPAVEVAELKKRLTAFSAPQSYLVLRPGDKLLTILRARLRQSAESSTVVLRGIRRVEESDFIKRVTQEIGARYDGITKGFAKSLLDTHRLGKDPRGIFTTKKEVLTICDRAGTRLGYTVLTYKIGGCVKTGPTIVLPKYRRQGIGSRTRELILERVRESGTRKLYCTCPDDDEIVFRYLLKAGFTVEAHLKSHYHSQHGEFVLGRFVSEPESPSSFLPAIGAEQCSVVSLDEFSKRMLYKELLRIMRRIIPAMSSDQMRGIIDRASSQLGGEIEDKPLRIWCLKRREECKGLLLLIPKRGGSVKGLAISETTNEATLELLLETAERSARELNGRKLYFLTPLSDALIWRFLRSSGYNMEGALREPYAVGEDVLVLAKEFAVVPNS